MSTQSNMLSQNSTSSQISVHDKFMSQPIPLSLSKLSLWVSLFYKVILIAVYVLHTKSNFCVLTLYILQLIWRVTIAIIDKLKAYHNGWYYHAY